MKKRDRKQVAIGSADDTSLFRDSVADAVPLATGNRAHPERPRPAPVARQRLQDEKAALASSLAGPGDWDDGVETGEELQYLRAGIARDTLRKLRKVHWKIQSELDLHGLTTPEAHEAVSEFLAHCLASDLRCVRIVHGKGLRSRNQEPVLKGRLARWLIQREDVLAYCQARRTEGGSGAVVVLLKGNGRR